MFEINGKWWSLHFVGSNSNLLKRSNGTITLAVTDANTSTVYVNNRLSGAMLEKVICHELVHCFSFSYFLNIPIETEELIADFLATYGRDVFSVADEILGRFARVA